MSRSFPYVLVTDRKIYPEPLIPYLKKRIPALSPFPAALILREKDLPLETYRALFNKVAQLCKDWRLPLLAHNHPELALDEAIAGVHMPLKNWVLWSKSHPQKAAYLLEKGKMKLPYPHGVGISVHLLSEVETALQLGASYLIVSPLFPTSCKPNSLPLGLTQLPDFIRSSPRSIYVLGGLSWPDPRASQLEALGVRGAVVRSAII
ncbi:MAG: thiamine phosphate synthase [Acidaminococcus sp.]|uniref:Thiamine phosphate synthase n=1 Tax=Acidaminococcus intestini TaxID=187327 RepID=A0A943EI98_9FIRM|nr:thiamine phosphate synthase [Acidaminococcus sp.]MBS5518775.1 thiamine phosphate synthase [Acidaminococcus intestini]MDY2740032.1 thiamine phosphate synthase [Acidaminococcus sp.]